MSEHGSSRRNGGFDGESAQIQRHQKKQDEEAQLKKIWEELENSEDGIEIDPDKFLRDLADLDELVPLPDFDLSASWQEFKEKHQDLLAGLEPADQQSSAFASEERPKRRRSMRPIRVVIALVLVMATLAVATSCGVLDQIIKAIGNWTENTFGFQLSQVLRVENPTPELPDTQYYDSLEEALEAYGVTTEYANTPLLGSFAFSEVRVFEYSNSIKFIAAYVAGEEEINFTIWHYHDSTSLELQAAEKLPVDAERHVCNGITHYILANDESTTTTWISGLEMYQLVSSVSENQSKQMIDSMYER